MNGLDKRSTERGQESVISLDGSTGQVTVAQEKLAAIVQSYQTATRLLKSAAIRMIAVSEYLKDASEEINQALERELD